MIESIKERLWEKLKEKEVALAMLYSHDGKILWHQGREVSGTTIGGEIRNFFVGARERQAVRANDPMAEVRRKIRAGESFWSTAWESFKKRDLNREQLAAFLKQAYIENSKSLVRLGKALHISEEEQPRFVSALHKYDIHPDPDRSKNAARS